MPWDKLKKEKWGGACQMDLGKEGRRRNSLSLCENIKLITKNAVKGVLYRKVA